MYFDQTFKALRNGLSVTRKSLAADEYLCLRFSEIEKHRGSQVYPWKPKSEAILASDWIVYACK